ncbi:class I SAM-dependent methyltransferase [Streptomyces sp. NPDC005146]
MRRVVRENLRPTFTARHVEWSPLASVVDLTPQPSRELIEISLRAGRTALDVDLSSLHDRAGGADDARFLDVWPGEHYRLLAALVKVLEPRTVVEVGTFRGMGTVALAHFAPGRVITYDVIAHDDFAGSCLRAEDRDRGVEQRIGDLSDPSYFASQLDDLRDAELIFIDGPKDGTFEFRLAELMLKHLSGSDALLVFDDIKLPRMVGFWRWLPLVKLDATSLGHFTGTGLARLSRVGGWKQSPHRPPRQSPTLLS